jgi:hypothetical protein
MLLLFNSQNFSFSMGIEFQFNSLTVNPDNLMESLTLNKIAIIFGLITRMLSIYILFNKAT